MLSHAVEVSSPNGGSRSLRTCRRTILERMHGSPTLLVDGTDPFAVPGQPPSLSCRLYRDAAGRMSGTPTVEALRRVLAG